MKHVLFSGDLECKIVNGKKILVPVNSIEPKYNAFLESLVPGQIVSCFLESNVDTGTLGQLSMVHALIRKLATEIGYSFQEIGRAHV